MESIYRLNQPQVVCEELIGELMLLHFGTGYYYNLPGTGADVCIYLFSGGTLESAVEALSDHFGIDKHKVEQDVAEFASSLVQEGLLVADKRAPSTEPMQLNTDAYEPPKFQKFDDMADQLLLDKIDDQNPGVTESTPKQP